MSDNMDKCCQRITASILKADFDTALTECQAAEKQFGYHWTVDLARGYAFKGMGRSAEAEREWERVETHHSSCPSPLCFSKIALLSLFAIADEQGNHSKAFFYIQQYLINNEDDIVGLFFRGEVRTQLSKSAPDETEKDTLVNDAICDFKKATDLLKRITDGGCYNIKIARDLAETHHDEMINHCTNVVDASFMHIFFNSTRNAAQENVYTAEPETLLGSIIPLEFMKLWIGFDSVDALLEVSGTIAHIDYVLSRLNDLVSIARQNGNVGYHAWGLYLIASVNMEMHTQRLDRNDMHHIDHAESAFADLLLLRNQHPFPDEPLREIDTLETKIDNARRKEI